MRYLLDTHVYLWWVWQDARISDRARLILADGDAEVLFSAVSAWEIAIKVGLGRLTTDVGLRRLVVEEPATLGFEPLPVRAAHTIEVGHLPMLHRDPFDRLLVAQARAEDLTILTRDRRVASYEVPVVW